MTLSLGPVPETYLRLTPVSSGVFFAKGEANDLPLSAGSGYDYGLSIVIGHDLFSSVYAYYFSCLGASFGAPALKSLNFCTSSLFSTTIATISPSLTSLDPSGYRSLAIYPSSCISKSTVALSVSIYAKISPGLIESPSCFNHLAMLPYTLIINRIVVPFP
jgi:hypothetical protein